MSIARDKIIGGVVLVVIVLSIPLLLLIWFGVLFVRGVATTDVRQVIRTTMSLQWIAISSMLNPVHLKEMVIGTVARERQWAKRHLSGGNDWADIKYKGTNDEWVMAYWNSRNHSHRQFLVDEVATFQPFSRVLEIGCNCAPNLYLLAKRFPEVRFTGIDINTRAIELGRTLLTDSGITNVNLTVSRADGIAQFADNAFDVVFTDALLIYIGKDKINYIIRNMARITKRGLVLMEMQMPRKPLGVYHRGVWMRDYTRLLLSAGISSVRTTPVTRDMWNEKYHWMSNGVIVTAMKEKMISEPYTN